MTYSEEAEGGEEEEEEEDDDDDGDNATDSFAEEPCKTTTMVSIIYVKWNCNF